MSNIESTGWSEPVIDTMVQWYPGKDEPALPFPREVVRDEHSLSVYPSPTGLVEHLFRDQSERGKFATDKDFVLAELERWNVRKAQVPVYPHTADDVFEVIENSDGRLFATLRVDPNDGMRAVRDMQRLASEHDCIKSITYTPVLTLPQRKPNDKEVYPVYTKAAELGLPIMITVGVPALRGPSACGDPMLLDEVCWFFPELTVVLKHCGEPWVDLCVKLLEKWPNLYYATTAYAPRRYPPAILRYMRTRRGRDKVIYGGYYPTISFEQLFTELDALDLPEDVRRKFLHDNAAKLFDLGEA